MKENDNRQERGLRVAVIGGGAAGCFCAAVLARRRPDVRITVYEAHARLMVKLALTGGGRCNLTHDFSDVDRLADVYPRGEQLMRRALRVFSPEDCCRWFEREGVRLVTQADHCVFPASQDAMQVVRTLERLLRQGNVRLCPGCAVTALSRANAMYQLQLADGRIEMADRVVVATGGGAIRLLEPLGLSIEPLVPSLFTLKIPDDGLRSLMGTVVDNAVLRLAGTRFRSEGTLLLTDWGVSGPATLKLSSYAARYLAEQQYRASLLVNWTGELEASVQDWVDGARASQKQLSGLHPDGLTDRLWRHLLGRSGLRAQDFWRGLGDKGARRLTAVLTADAYPVEGRAQFKEEFVTCGGVSLQELHPATLEARRYPGLFFAGEVLDIDAITGGFNLQAAWSSAYVVASSL